MTREAASDTDVVDRELEQALADGEAVLARCTECGTAFWHPRPHCPNCGSAAVALVAAPGPARIYTATTNRRPRGGDGVPPAQIGYVEFAEGVRVLANLRFPDGPPEIGAEVVADRELDGETARLVFRPAPGA